ncbi:transposase [Azospirillum agricola]|uniref:transposase n=1 Tax=Azospirillum agricola TaxID=1720247 RepID=UPI0037BE4798
MARPAVVGLGGDAGTHPPWPLPTGPRIGRPRGQPVRRRDRQPERPRGGKGGPAADPAGYGTGKTIKGVKHHILVDTPGPLLNVAVHRADIHDRDGSGGLSDTAWVSRMTASGVKPHLLRLPTRAALTRATQPAAAPPQTARDPRDGESAAIP